MPATRKHLHISKPRRRQRSVSLTTRASRCGVKNYVNVLKSAHPTVELFFPVTKQYLQEYIDAKKKQGTIKANSLDQYFQHIESYNMALGHGWDSQEFEPMMREVLEALVQNEEKCGITRKPSSSPDEEEDELSHENSNGIVSFNHCHSSSPSISLVCFDMAHVPAMKLERQIQVPTSNVDPNAEPNVALQQLYQSIVSVKFPKKWGKIDPATVYFRNSTWKDAPHFMLDDDTFKCFWETYTNRREGEEIQLIVYSKQRSVTPVVTTTMTIQPAPPMQDTEMIAASSKAPATPLTPRKSPPRLQQIPSLDFSSGAESSTPSPTFIQQLKSVTVRSPNRVYKQNIAVTDKTTFSSLLLFAIKRQPPPGKQFVLQSADGELEYMPEDPVRNVIHGTIHADVVVKVEDIREIDFNQF